MQYCLALKLCHSSLLHVSLDCAAVCTLTLAQPSPASRQGLKGAAAPQEGALWLQEEAVSADQPLFLYQAPLADPMRVSRVQDGKLLVLQTPQQETQSVCKEGRALCRTAVMLS